MAFVRPTLAEIAVRVRADFVSRLELVGAVLQKSVVHVMSMVIAGAAHMLHGHLEFLSEQLFADTAESSFLVRLASLFGLDRQPAAFAGGPVEITGTNGTVIPAGTVLVRADGLTYETDAEVTISAGVAAVEVTSTVASEDSNTEAGVVLSFESPVAGADAEVEVAVGGLVDGADEEDFEVLRARLIARMRDPPNGGSTTDYVAWAREVPGITRAWVYPGELGAGTVVVRPVRDEDAGTIIPSVGEVAAVQAHLDEVRPVTAIVTVLAPIDAPIEPEISITPDTTTTRAAVEAELADLFALAEPGETMLKSQFDLAVGSAAGVTDYTVTVPAADVVHATGELATLGTITWS